MYNYSLKEIIKEAVSTKGYSSRSKIADHILETFPEVKDQLSHRTLRKYVSEYMAETITDKEVILKSPIAGAITNPTQGTSAQSHGADQKYEFSSQGDAPMSLEEVMERFRIDKERYYVRQYWAREEFSKSGESSKWRYTLHVALIQTPQKDIVSGSLETLGELLREGLSHRIQIKPHKASLGLVALADIHAGAKVSLSQHTPEFSYQTLIKKLDNIAAIVNEKAYEKVVVSLLGDMIHTFSGLNHPDNWMEIHGDGKGMGAKAVKITYQILMNFLHKIHNLKEVVVVSGNHDRIGIKKTDDPRGQVADLLAFMLSQGLKEVEVTYDPILVSKEYDGIQYLMTHNHLPIAKRPIPDLILAYGNPKLYNILLGGHYHRKALTKVYMTENENIVDTKNYRAEIVSPLFTGDFYSSSMGFSCQAGFRIYERGPFASVPNSFDYTI